MKPSQDHREVFIQQPGYDSLTGLNTGDLGYQSLQGTLNGGAYYAPVPFNPAATSGFNQDGYIDFGANYNPDPSSAGNSDYFYYGNYGEALAASNPGGKAVSYGSAQTNSLVGTPGNGDPTINGVDYTQGASYASEFKQGIGAPNPNYGGYRAADFGQGTPQSGIVPYNQYTEPGYKPHTETPAGPTGVQSYGPDGQPIATAAPGAQAGTFLFGNNGSLGSLSGTFSNNRPMESTQFFSGPQGYNPAPYQNPALQALNQSRTQ